MERYFKHPAQPSFHCSPWWSVIWNGFNSWKQCLKCQKTRTLSVRKLSNTTSILEKKKKIKSYSRLKGEKPKEMGKKLGNYSLWQGSTCILELEEGLLFIYLFKNSFRVIEKRHIFFFSLGFLMASEVFGHTSKCIWCYVRFKLH